MKFKKQWGQKQFFLTHWKEKSRWSSSAILFIYFMRELMRRNTECTLTHRSTKCSFPAFPKADPFCNEAAGKWQTQPMPLSHPEVLCWTGNHHSMETTFRSRVFSLPMDTVKLRLKQKLVYLWWLPDEEIGVQWPDCDPLYWTYLSIDLSKIWTELFLALQDLLTAHDDLICLADS